MKVIIQALARTKPKTFKLSYTPEYKTYIQHHAFSDPQHPLHIPRRREMKERKEEGLWWHVTTGIDLSKSGVVRSWCRRRLRNAFTEELKAQGFDKYGRLVHIHSLAREHRDLALVLQTQKDFSLTGSVRLHITPALVAAKYMDVRREADLRHPKPHPNEVKIERATSFDSSATKAHSDS
ncbi:hypothetical protein N0V90_005677 [Kalmusia sp. IMI 367209]|nr:hypothetical protein N0V90_005677 [Kalmusia sp. IMI 367209]